MEYLIDYENFDKFDRKPFADRLTQGISKLYPFYDGAYVLSLNGGYGSGKTTFLKMWYSQLDKDGYKVIYLNAWENDFDNEPIIPIAKEMIERIEEDDSADEERSIKTRSALRKVLAVTALAANGMFQGATGINVHEIESELAKATPAEKQTKIEKLGLKLSKAHSLKKEIYGALREGLTNYSNGLGEKPLIVLVDELDRVQPDYAVRFLEAIKHIFSIKGICFVLALDKRQLEASVKQLFGDINFPNYYRKFVTIEANLPRPSNVSWHKFFEQVFVEYFDAKEREGIAFAFKEGQRELMLKTAVDLCTALSLTPREVKHMFRVFVQFMAVENHHGASDEDLQMSLFLIAMMMSEEKDYYQQLGLGRCKPAQIKDLFVRLSFLTKENKNAFRDLFVCTLAYSLTRDNGAGQHLAADIVNGVYETEELEYSRDIFKNKASGNWKLPRNKSAFQDLYEKIEGWRDFIS